jgi:Xaa-Pro aminopeptidase
MSSSVISMASEMNLELPGQAIQESSSDRRADVDAKQGQVAELLARIGCEGLLVLDQANLAWLSAGGSARSVLNPEDLPALYYTAGQRWLIVCNVDSQRMFDEELDHLGFLLKEWPWPSRREQVLADLCMDRRLACDMPFQGAQLVTEQLRVLRRAQSAHERACSRLLGQMVAHAVEATCRSAQPGETERELAAQVAHRLYRRGALPVAVSVTADGRARTYRRHGFTSAPIQTSATINVTARKYGLHATAARTFTFGMADETLKKEHLTACRVAANYASATWPNAVPKELLASGRRIYRSQGFEHEWDLAPQGYVTGRTPVEQPFEPELAAVLGANWAVTWTPSAGAAVCCDTYLVREEEGPLLITPTESWPLVGVRISGLQLECPNILER